MIYFPVRRGRDHAQEPGGDPTGDGAWLTDLPILADIRDPMLLIGWSVAAVHRRVYNTPQAEDGIGRCVTRCCGQGTSDI